MSRLLKDFCLRSRVYCQHDIRELRSSGAGVTEVTDLKLNHSRIIWIICSRCPVIGLL